MRHVSDFYISLRFSNLQGKARVLPIDKIRAWESGT